MAEYPVGAFFTGRIIFPGNFIGIIQLGFLTVFNEGFDEKLKTSNPTGEHFLLYDNKYQYLE